MSQPLHERKLLIIFVVGLIGGVIADRLVSGNFANADPGLNMPLISQAWSVIQQTYVDRAALKPDTVTYGAIDGLVNALGDTGHSRFLTPELKKKLKQLEQNKFEGIGAEVRVKEGHLVIVAPMPGSPALKAGLRPGDIILKVNDANVTGMSIEQAIERITGPAGTQVKLTIMSKPDTTRDVTVTRERITIHEVTWHMLAGTRLAQIHISNFGKGAGDDLIKALKSAKESGAEGLILDLRNDPGGLLREAITTASQFLAGGNVLLEKNAEGKIKPVPVEAGGIALQIPMVLLINGGSASASEIVAGALRDNKRAQLVGEKTFGTGTVLAEFGLRDGSELLLAVQEWLTPGGHVIWHQGIAPDIQVSLPAEADPVFPESDQIVSGVQWRDIKDTQLVRAIELLSR